MLTPPSTLALQMPLVPPPVPWLPQKRPISEGPALAGTYRHLHLSTWRNQRCDANEEIPDELAVKMDLSLLAAVREHEGYAVKLLSAKRG
mmetsp:Transcript_9522/g.12928  ORF Transcript_9522/g.12928 Transcript_9522/m.12928 type:complete len:90 (-) Transcript_9522:491-760(-)